MSTTTRATIYGVISTLEKYDIDEAKRILFQMAQDMDRQYDTETQRLRRKADVFDQLDAYGCSSATVWLDAEASRPSVTAPQGVTVDQILEVVNDWRANMHLIEVPPNTPYSTGVQNVLRSRLSALLTK